MDNLKEIIKDYKENKLLLFVGAGVSANLGLPTWSKLIDKIADDLGYDPDVFKTYGDFLALAEFYKLKKGGLGDLRSWMDRNWHDPKIDVGKSGIHELIAKGQFSRIYTTNYDNWLEYGHDHFGVSYDKVVSVSDLALPLTSDKQIIKFHGDFSKDNSIVLDETSYFERLKFESPLDLKFRADVLGKSVLFIGYSLNDINVRQLFYKLSNTWSQYGAGIDKPNSYLFSSTENPIQKTILEQWGIKTVNSDIDDRGAALEDFLDKVVNH